MATFFATDDASFDVALASAAGNGAGVDTIVLAAGTYSAAHTINTAVIVNGAKVGEDGTAAGRGLAESVLSGGLQINIAGVTIDGVQVTGANDFGNAPFTTGIQVAAAGVTIQNTRFDGTTGFAGLIATTAATGLIVTRNAFAGYDNGIHAEEGAAGTISANTFSRVNGDVGISTESTGVVISLNSFLNGGGAGAAVFASPNGSADISAQVLANNTITQPPGTPAIDIEVRGAGAFTVTGTAFADAIRTADDPNHAGALTFNGLGGNDEMWGGTGNDTFDGGAGNDILHGQTGNDTASYVSATSGVTVSLAIAGQQDTVGAGLDTLDDIDNLTGSGLNDTLTGDGNNNIITGGAGLDTMNAAGGDDTFVVNAGDTVAGEIYSGGANTGTGDTLRVTGTVDFTGTSLLSIENLTFATGGTSTATFTTSQIGGGNLSSALAVTGDANTNKIIVNMSSTLLNLSAWTFSTWTAGTDTITVNGTTSGDTITGTTQNDIINAGLGNDAMDGGAGDDTIIYTKGDGSDSIDGGANTGVGDTLAVSGTSASETLAVVVTGPTIVTLEAGLVSNIEHVTLDLAGGTGDTLDYTGSSAVTVNLATGVATGFETAIAGVENVTGGSGVDSLTGDGNANTLAGGSNDDTLTGRGGMDTLLGGTGNDTFIVNAGDEAAGETYDGGANTDTLQVTGNVNFTGSALLAIENLAFATVAASTVTLTSSQIGGTNLSGTLAVTGDAETNSFIVNMNGPSLDLSGWTFGGTPGGTDTITINGTSAAETITGSTQNDFITGGTGLDTINAGTGDDTLIANAGDVVTGETYDGGANTDTLRVTGTADFTGTTLLSIERLTFVTTGTSTATFTLSQLGGGNLSSALAVTGDGQTNRIVVNMNGTLLNLSPWTFTSWTAGTDTITLNGSASGDTITGTTQNDIIAGGLGNDAIDGSTGDDTINYTINEGSDTVDGGTNTGVGDTLAISGTANSDMLAVTLTGSTILSVAGGSISNIEHVTLNMLGGTSDTLDYTGSTAVVVNLTGVQSATGFDSVAGVENVTGGSGADQLTGDANANTLNGGTNDDTLTGLAGVDTLIGGAGNDTFIVNAGDAASGETYSGGTETDTLQVTGSANFTGAALTSIEQLTFAAAAASVVTLTSSQIGTSNLAAALVVTADAFNNDIVINMDGTLVDLSGWSFVGWTPPDTITIFGSAIANTITGSTQNDAISGGGGNDAIQAGGGNDAIYYTVGDGSDLIDGGGGTGDTLVISGTAGNDALAVVVSGGVINSVAGGTLSNVEHVLLDLLGGSDTLDYTNSTGPLVVNLNGAQSATGFDTVAGVENVIGAAGADQLTGNASANTLDGGAGADTLTGLGGLDTLLGRAGDDTFVVNAGDALGGETYDGGADSDTLQVTDSADFVGSALLSIEKLTFATSFSGFVSFTSSQVGGANLAAGLAVTGDGNGNNITIGMNSGSLDLSGWSFSNWTAGSDTITIFGTAVAETITGSIQSDVINGGFGNDSLNGGNGNDRLNTGQGADSAVGGLGADTFIFDGVALADAQSQAALFDRVTDYSFAAGDQLDFSAILATAYALGGGQPVGTLVRAVAIGSGTNIQVDTDGAVNGANWTTIARLDNVRGGDTVNVILDSSLPAGTPITVQRAPTASDLGGDGKSDVLLQHTSGQVVLWHMNGNQIAANLAVANPPPQYQVVGTGDFNGDGKSDVVLRHDTGQVVLWQMNGNQIIGNTAVTSPGTSYKVVGTGDFGGDGKSDILLRHDSGQIVMLQMNGDQIISNAAVATPGPTYHVAGTGDFNGDGRSDILLRHDSGQLVMMQMNGTQTISNTAIANLGTGYHVAGTGDFNGDGKSDILLRHDTGQIVMFQMNGDQIIGNSVVADPGAQWRVSEVGDYNGDGLSDILLRHDNGQIVEWQMNGSTIVNNLAVEIPSNEYKVVPPPSFEFL